MTKIAVFASGRGSNCRAIYDATKSGVLNAQLALIVTNSAKAGIVEFAAAKSISIVVLDPADFESARTFGEAILSELESAGIQWTILAGYIKKIPANVVEQFQNRITNIHPALLPAFGGKGMYGMNVHRAVLSSGAKLSGLTVHLVNNEYDAGPIVLQKAVDISACGSAEEIAKRVLELEHSAYSEALKLLFENEFSIENNKVVFESRT